MIDSGTSARLIGALQESRLAGAELRQFAMQLLNDLPHYDWSGVYRLEGDMLVLDEFQGAATDHTHIPVGRGVCGTAVKENRNQVIADVRNLENYLACSTQTRSEIVVLIRSGEGVVLGQIDIDGHQVGAFDHSDESLLESISKILADRWR